ncbi:MAG: ankyrin repeat domain-containing protein [Pseudomonadota bacterium]
MPSSDLERRCLVLIALVALSAPARAFDMERDAWLLDGLALPGVERQPTDPLEYGRIRASANDRAPEFAGERQRQLITAAQQGDRAGLEALLKQGVNPNGRIDPWSRTALIHAVDRGDVEMVRLLLEGGADPDMKAGGHTPLVLAALHGHARIVKQLLAGGADPDLKSGDGNTPLTAAAGMNRLAALEALLAAHPDPRLHNREGRTALSLAALEGFEAAVRIMLEAGVDPNVLDRNGGTALTSAGFDDNNKSIVGLLVRHGAATQ